MRLTSSYFDLRKSAFDNAQSVLEDIKGGQLASDIMLSKRIRDGYATDSEKEVDHLYDRFPVLTDIIQDLATLLLAVERDLYK